MDFDDRAFPLTQRQLDIWLAQETGQSGAEWQLGLFVKIQGALDPGLFRRAISTAMQEAEPFRAAFFQADGHVFQKAIDYPDVELDFHDLTRSYDPVEEARAIASSIQRTPMPLAGPLFKLALCRTGTDEYYWSACCHHIVIDGTGIALVGRRIAAIYSAMAAGKPIPPAFFGSLRDLVSSEAAYEASPDYAEDQAYWSDNFPQDGGLDCRPSQSVDEQNSYHPSPPVQLSPSVVGQTKSLAKLLGVRRSSILTAACALLVRGLSAGGSEVVFDFPVSRRVTPESKLLPGMIAGVVPLVLQASPNSSVADFCKHVDTRVREALKHQRFPVRGLEWEGDFRGPREPARRVVLNFVPARLTLDLAGVPATATYTTFGPVGHFGLFFLGFGDEQLFATAGAGQPFSNFDVADLARRLHRVVEAMTADPGRPLWSLDVLEAAECARLEVLGNRSGLSRPLWPVSIPELFAAQVARTPEAVALRGEGCSLTYGELDAAANRLAHRLAGLGTGPGQCVGLLSSRSVAAVVGIVAVLKTGAAYLPIDPALPVARVEFMLADAAPIALLTTQELAPRLHGSDVPVVDLHDPCTASYPASAPAAPDSDDIAHVIYTSGTTGTPKGAAVTHHNVTQLLGSLHGDLRGARVWAQCHSLAFDASVEEDLECPAARGSGGGGSRVGDELIGRPARLADCRTRRGVAPDAVGGRGAVPAGLGVHRVGGRRGGLLGRGGGSVVAGAGDGQRLRPDRNHHLRGPKHATVPRDWGPSDRFPGGGGGVVCAGWVVACGAGGGGGGVVCGRGRGGGGLHPPGELDRVAVCGVFVRGAGVTDVSHRGFGAVGCRWAVGVCGPG